MSRVTPGRSAMGPVRKAVLTAEFAAVAAAELAPAIAATWPESGASSTAWPLAQWSRACWMRMVSSADLPVVELAERASISPLVAAAVVRAAFSVMQVGGMMGSVTLRVSCAFRDDAADAMKIARETDIIRPTARCFARFIATFSILIQCRQKWLRSKWALTLNARHGSIIGDEGMLYGRKEGCDEEDEWAGCGTGGGGGGMWGDADRELAVPSSDASNQAATGYRDSGLSVRQGIYVVLCGWKAERVRREPGDTVRRSAD